MLNNMSAVAVTRCNDYENLKSQIDRHFNYHGGVDNFFLRGEKVLIKPNLLAPPQNSLEPVTTDARIIIAVAEFLIDHGVLVSVGDSPGFSTVDVILEKIGARKKLQEMGAKIIEFDRPIKRLKSLSIDRAIFEHDKLFNLPKMKVHMQMQYTLCVKNMFGCVSGKRKPLLHMLLGKDEDEFSEMLLRHYESVRPAFTLMDGIIAMGRKGPRGGVEKKIGLLFSGSDCVAIDSVIVKALGLSTEEYPILRAAKKLGIGEWREDKIQILGADSVPEIPLAGIPQSSLYFYFFRVVKSVVKHYRLKRLAKRKKKNAG